MNGKKKEKKSGSVWGIVITAAALLASLADDPDSSAIVIFLLIVAAVIFAVRKAKKKTAKNAPMSAAQKSPSYTGAARPQPQRTAAAAPAMRAKPETRSSAYHNHDSIAAGGRVAESEQEHWKRQLDGFIQAGLIDREEYRMLLERRK